MLPLSPMAVEEREVGEFAAVVLDTPGKLTVTEGEPSLVVHAPERALARLTSDVDDGALVLGAMPGFAMGLLEVRYELTVRELAAIEVNGSGDAEVTVPGASSVRVTVNGSGDVSWTGRSGDDVEVRVAGSGDLRLVGETTDLSLQIDGSGDIDAGGLDARGAWVVIRGSGDATVDAEDHLVVQIAGSGRVTYFGDPRLDTEIWGSGEVVRS